MGGRCCFICLLVFARRIAVFKHGLVRWRLKEIPACANHSTCFQTFHVFAETTGVEKGRRGCGAMGRWWGWGPPPPPLPPAASLLPLPEQSLPSCEPDPVTWLAAWGHCHCTLSLGGLPFFERVLHRGGRLSTQQSHFRPPQSALVGIRAASFRWRGATYVGELTRVKQWLIRLDAGLRLLLYGPTAWERAPRFEVSTRTQEKKEREKKKLIWLPSRCLREFIGRI